MTTPGGIVLPTYAGKKVTGVIVRPNGLETLLTSGYAGPSLGVKGVPYMNGNIKSHVEAHVAIVMRRQGLLEATLYINKVPCPTQDPRSPGCMDALPHMLPAEARLRVVGPGGFDQTFVGLPDPGGISIRGL